MELKSSAFGNGQRIPVKYSCDGQDVNPPLEIISTPAGTKSFALIVDDPDAPRGTWIHWVLFNIPAHVGAIKENSVPSGAKQGINDFRKLNYGGPCPPSGTHRYFFKIYALDKVLELVGNVSKTELENAMRGHVIEKAELVGVYSRG